MSYSKHTEANAPQRFWIWVDKGPDDECWEWQGTRRANGYGRFARVPGDSGMAHRYSYELHHGPIPSGLFVLHSCDNPPCVNPAHLRAGTHAENMADKARRGRCNPNARTFKLTDDDVRQIRRLYLPGEHHRFSRSNATELARRFGVTREHIEAVANRRARQRVG